MLLQGLRCTVCDVPEVIALAPGEDGDDFADLFAIRRPVATRAWCSSCWPANPRPAVPGTTGMTGSEEMAKELRITVALTLPSDEFVAADVIVKARPMIEALRADLAVLEGLVGAPDVHTEIVSPKPRKSNFDRNVDAPAVPAEIPNSAARSHAGHLGKAAE